MTVTAQTPYNTYTAAPGATVFSSAFRVIQPSDLVVKINGTTKTSGFTVSGLGAAGGVDVTFTTPMTGGEKVELLREVPLTRATDYQQLGDFLSLVVNQDFDRQWMAMQGMSARIGGAVRAPYPEQVQELPAAALRANKALVFDALGHPAASKDDFNDQLANVTEQAGIATEAASTATTQAGIATEAAEAAEVAQLDIQTNWGDKLAAADANADAAAVSAGAALASQNAAGASATAAQADRVLAQTAALAAFAEADVYASIAAAQADGGLANGAQYQIVSADGSTMLRYRKDSSSASTGPLASYPTAQSVDVLRNPGQNLLDKDQPFLANTRLDDSGLPIYDAAWPETLSDFIPVSASTAYIHNLSINVKFAQYTAARVFVSGTIASVTRTMPITTSATTAFFRIEIDPAVKAALMLEQASTPGTAYVPYVNAFNQDFVDVEALIADAVFAASVPKISYGKNLFNINGTLKAGTAIGGNGFETPLANRWVTDFIKIKPSTQYCNNYNLNTPVYFYGARKEFISSSGSFNNSTPVTSPSGAVYARLVLLDSLANYTKFQIEEGAAFTYFEPYVEHYQGALNPRSVNSALGWASNKLAFPSRQYFLTGKQNNMYYQAIQRRYVPDLYYTTITGGITNKARCGRVTPASATTLNMTARLYDGDFNIIDTKTATGIVTSHTTPTTACKLLAIGDSQTFGGEWIGTMVASIPAVTTLGIRNGATSGFTTVKTEGRSGWTLNDYFTDFGSLPFDGFTPFMHPTDSRRYMGTTRTWLAVAATPNAADVVGMTGIYATLAIDGTGRPTRDPGSVSLAAGAVVYNNSAASWQEWNGSAWNNISAPTMEFNFYKYLSTFGVETPTLVTVMLGTNGFGAPNDVTAEFVAFKDQMDTLIASCFAAGVSKIGLMIPPSTTGPMENTGSMFTRLFDARMWEVRRMLIQEYDNKTGNNIFLIDAGSALDPDYGFFYAAAEKPFDEFTGTETIKPVFNTPHPSTQGYMQMATRVAAWVQAVR